MKELEYGCGCGCGYQLPDISIMSTESDSPEKQRQKLFHKRIIDNSHILLYKIKNKLNCNYVTELDT